jgi:plastocyanin
MRRGKRKLAAFAAVALLAGALVGTAGPAKAQGTLDVQVGAPLFELAGGAPADGMRFMAPPLTVHKGDTLNFGFAGFHTATLLPVGQDPAAWIEANATGLDEPYNVIQLDPDDTGIDPGSSDSKPAVKFNNNVALPNEDGLPLDPQCGAAPNACSYDGGSVLNSGLPLAQDVPPFSVLVDANPGDTFWVICLLHPNMLLQVNVVASNETATTQAEVDAYRDATAASDAAAAAELHAKHVNKRVKRNGAWQAFGGMDGDGFALLGNYPSKLVIRKGDRVRWRFDRLPFEIHTVSFPKSEAREIIRNDFVPACDPDGDTGPGPDNPPEMEAPPFCNDPSQLEIELTALTVHQYGNGTFRGGDFETSGVRGDFGVSTEPYTLKFAKRSPKKGFKYMCMIHGGFMDGTVVVKKRR